MTEESTIPLVAGVRFSKVGKVYHFLARDIPDLILGDQVVVETSRGWQLGTVAQVLSAAQYHQEGMKTIDRRATPRDLLLRQSWQAKEAEVLEVCKARALELRLNGVKIVGAEYSYDGTRLGILFSTESEEKYDLKSLRQDMQRAFQPSQVELRQIGPRDVAKMMGGMGACGLENRCCSQFLCEFSSISIRMAKEQGISLTPTEITGMCGRLRCCLIYEYEQYTDARALLPKKNRRIMTPAGEARVLDQIPMRDSVYVVLMDDTRREFKRAEIQLIDENGVLTPAMSDEERQTLAAELPPPEPEIEEQPAATYTLPPQRRESERPQQRSGQGSQGQRPQGQRPQGQRPPSSQGSSGPQRPQDQGPRREGRQPGAEGGEPGAAENGGQRQGERRRFNEQRRAPQDRPQERTQGGQPPARRPDEGQRRGPQGGGRRPDGQQRGRPAGEGGEENPQNRSGGEGGGDPQANNRPGGFQRGNRPPQGGRPRSQNRPPRERNDREQGGGSSSEPSHE